MTAKLKYGWTKDIAPTLRIIAPGRYVEEITAEVNRIYGTNFSEEQIRNALIRIGVATGNRCRRRVDKAANTIFFEDMRNFIKVHQYDYDNDEMYLRLHEAFPDRTLTRAALIRFRRKHRLTYRVLTPEMLEFCKENKRLPRKELAALLKKNFGKEIDVHCLNAILSYYRITYDLSKMHAKRQSMHKVGDKRERHGHKGASVYTEIMVAPGKWVQYQRYLYEQYHNVKLDKKMNVIFVDGNHQNFAKENLRAVPVNYMAIMANKGVWNAERNKENLDIGITLSQIALKKKELKKIMKDKKNDSE